MINDLRNSNNWRAMSKSQRGCYIDLLCAAWTESNPATPCSLTSDRASLYRQTDCFTEQDREDTEFVLSRMFQSDEEGRLFNPRQRAVWEEQIRKSQSRQGAANVRWEKERAKKLQAKMQNECNADANASGVHDVLYPVSHMPTVSVSVSNTSTESTNEVVPVQRDPDEEGWRKRVPSWCENLSMPVILNTLEARDAIKEFVVYRLDKGKPLPPESVDKMLRRFAKEKWSPRKLTESLEHSMSQGYDGVVEKRDLPQGRNVKHVEDVFAEARRRHGAVNDELDVTPTKEPYGI